MDDIKQGYKRTDVGVIPDDWEVVVLANLTVVIGDGIHATPNYVESSDYFFINGNNLDSGHVVFTTNTRCISSDEYSKFKQQLSKQTILMSINGTIGNLAFFRGEKVLLGKSAAYINLLDEVSKQFIYYVLQSPAVLNFYEDELTGTTIRNLSLKSIRATPITLPPTLEEQRAIADALSAVDEQITALDDAIAKKRDIKQGAMQRLLTGEERLPGFSGEWEVKKLKDVATLNGRIGWQGLKKEEFTNDSNDPFLITGMNFKDGLIRWHEVYHIPNDRYEQAPEIQLRPGDVLMTKDGTIGKLLFVDHIPYPHKASLNSHLLVFRPIRDGFDPKFLFYQLGSVHFQKHIDQEKSGSTFFGITQESVGEYLAILPSIDEQRAIATVLSDMDAEITALEDERDKTIALKQGMMQDLLTGKVRLV